MRHPKRSAAAPDQLDETGRSRLGIGKRVMRPAMHHPEFPAEPLQADGVTKIEKLRSEPSCVQVVSVEAGADRAAD